MLAKTQYKIIKDIIELEGKKRKSSGVQNEEMWALESYTVSWCPRGLEWQMAAPRGQDRDAGVHKGPAWALVAPVTRGWTWGPAQNSGSRKHPIQWNGAWSTQPQSGEIQRILGRGQSSERKAVPSLHHGSGGPNVHSLCSVESPHTEIMRKTSPNWGIHGTAGRNDFLNVLKQCLYHPGSTGLP